MARHLLPAALLLLATLPFTIDVFAWPGPAPSSSWSSSTSSKSCSTPPYADVTLSTSHEWNGRGGSVFNDRLSRDVAGNFQSSGSSHGGNADSSLALSLTCPDNHTRGVSATPTILGDTSYYPTYSGLLVALNYVTCQPYWTYNVSQAIVGYAPLTHFARNVGVHRFSNIARH